jgi:hypothetical protein
VSFFSRGLAFGLALAAVAAIGIAGAQSQPPSAIGPKPHSLFLDKNSFMNQPNSFYYFHNMDKLGFKQDWVRHAGPVFALQEPTQPFSVQYTYRGGTYTLDQYLARNYTTGFMVLHDNQILYERYLHGSTRSSRFLSNSMAKSITSTLVGCAIDDGKIASVNDKIVTYLPYLQASAGYRDVTIKQLLEMATGVNFDENYLDPKANVYLLTNALVWGSPSFKDLAISMGRKRQPGTVFEYQSINTQVLGLLVEKVTGEPLNQYLQEKIWQKIGAESDGFLYRSPKQADQCAFGCYNATLRDYARFSLMAMYGGRLDGRRVVSQAWMKEATTPGAKFLAPIPNGPHDAANQGYAYQWWIPYGRDGAFMAMGVYGQILYINPARHVVVVQTSAWPQPDTDARWDESQRMMDTIASKFPVVKP